MEAFPTPFTGLVALPGPAGAAKPGATGAAGAAAGVQEPL